jgi:hypothetical protein
MTCAFRIAAAAACATLLTAVPTAAHHSFAAEYDANRPITVTGTVQKLEWTNPHAWLYVEGRDQNGTQQVWEFELAPPNGLMRNGWRRDSLQPGQQVTVIGFRSKTSSTMANARAVRLSDGRQVFAGSSFGAVPVK